MERLLAESFTAYRCRLLDVCHELERVQVHSLGKLQLCIALDGLKESVFKYEERGTILDEPRSAETFWEKLMEDLVRMDVEQRGLKRRSSSTSVDMALLGERGETV